MTADFNPRQRERRSAARAWAAWRLKRRMPWLTYRRAWACCSGRRPEPIVGHVRQEETE